MWRAFGNVSAEPFQVVLQCSHPALVAVTGEDGSVVPHQLRQIGRFPARRRASVKHSFARLGIKKNARGRGAWILDVAMPGRQSLTWNAR